jgi:hypothetical protein
MGGTQTRELRIIYLEDCYKRCFPIKWPLTYTALLAVLATEFGYCPLDQLLMVDDACEEAMHVFNDTTFDALVPKHILRASEINVYFVNIRLDPSHHHHHGTTQKKKSGVRLPSSTTTIRACTGGTVTAEEVVALQ